jgi:hypothetical protein
MRETSRRRKTLGKEEMPVFDKETADMISVEDINLS